MKTASGAPYVITTAGSPTVILDFTNPAAVAYWQAQVTAALDAGADGFMEDYGEQVMPDMVFADGSTGATMHNLYPVLYHRATRQALDAYEQSHPGRQVFSYVRSGYSGSARYEAGNFPGDETVDSGVASGLASLAPDMLNRAVGGALGYSTDIGGYFNFVAPTSAELFLRWAAWSALTPFFRVHNNGLTGTLMPWDFDAATLAAYRNLAVLHQSFVPLIQRLWQKAREIGMPITQPLWLQYPGDPQAAAQQQEWLLGPDVLVAPVVASAVAARRSISRKAAGLIRTRISNIRAAPA